MTKFEQVLRALGDRIREVEPDGSWEYFRAHANRLVATFDRLRTGLDRGGAILDLGAWPGHLAFCLRELGYDVRGVDLDPGRISPFIRENVPIDRCDVETERLPFEDETFQHLFFLEMIEHLRINPLYSLREMNRVLKPGGHLYLTTPNVFALHHRIGGLLGRETIESPYRLFRKLELLGHCGHIRLYSASEVKEILENTGFAVEDIVHASPNFRIYSRRDEYGIQERPGTLAEVFRAQRLRGLLKRALLSAMFRRVPALQDLLLVVAQKQRDAPLAAVGC
jgi:SAM-dependent methyltransferase